MAMSPPVSAASATNRLSENIKHWSHISCNLLEAWMNEKVSDKKKLIIIDCRSAPEYNHLHIKNALNIGYSKIMRRRLLRDNYPISELLLKNSSNNFIDYQETNVVVYDNQSEHTNQLEADSFALILINKLVQKFKSVSFLTGGFVAFHTKYVSLCQPTMITPLQGPMVMAISPVSSNTSSASASLTTTPNEPSHAAASASSAATVTAASSAPPPPPPPPAVPHGGELTSPAYLNRISQSNLNLQVSSSRYEKICRFRSDFTLLDTFALANMAAAQNSSSSNVTSSSQASKASAEASDQPNGMREPTKILDFLYLGSQEDALSEVTMNALNITNVLNVSQTCPKPDFIADSHFLRIPVNDGHAARLIPFFDVGFRFIEKCRKANSKVIIHCLAGISRSPTLAIAYLMRYLSLNSDEAYNFVKQRRSTISPNLNFVGQLYEYEKQLQAASNAEKSAAAAQSMTPSGSFESLLKLGSDENNSSAGVSFLKIKKKLQNSAIASPIVAEASNFANDATIAPGDRPKDIVQKFSPPKIQRRKTYMFNSNTNTSTNASIATTTTNALNSSLCLVQANTPLCLQSPSTALATFDLNSPTATTHKTIDSSSTSSTSGSTVCHETPVVVHRCVPKSFTLDTINLSGTNNPNSSGRQFSGTLESLNASIEQKLAKSDQEKTVMQAPFVRSTVQMRRPTNFLTNLSPSSPMANPAAMSGSFFSPAFPATKECSTDVESTTSETAKPAAGSAKNQEKREKSPKRLKRPSSFLSGFSKDSPGVFMSSPFESAFKSASIPNDNDSGGATAASSLSQVSFEPKSKGGAAQRSSLTSFQQNVRETTTPQNLLNVNTTKSFFARTFSNTSAGSTASSCSCCSNISTTSSTLSSATSSNNACQCHVGSSSQTFSSQQQAPPENELESKANQQQDSKKMKLSPTRDQDGAKNFSLNSTATSESHDNAMDVSNTPVAEAGSNEPSSQTALASSTTPVHLPPASMLFNGDNKTLLAGFQSKARIEFRFSNTSSNQILTGSATTPTYINATLPCILNSFSSRLNESKSYETIKTLLDHKDEFKAGRVQRSSENATDKCFKSFESESDEESKSREDGVENKQHKNSSTALLSSLVKILPSNTNKSSSSSSKTGSNKNSLHGSIETMIPVL